MSTPPLSGSRTGRRQSPGHHQGPAAQPHRRGRAPGRHHPRHHPDEDRRGRAASGQRGARAAGRGAHPRAGGGAERASAQRAACGARPTRRGAGAPDSQSPGRHPQRRLFEPLMTTKPLGLGLGLTTARTLVENQGGALTFHSKPGEGARFEVSLRVAAASATSTPRAPP
ncbi:MAG: ATP-binding protein [Myxococcaceae bacterium]